MKQINVGDWVEISGEPGTHGSATGLVKAVTYTRELIVEINGRCSVENFKYCTPIAEPRFIGLRQDDSDKTPQVLTEEKV